MSLAAWYHRGLDSTEARERISREVKEIEQQSSAEIVVAVRAASASYRAADYLWGIAFASITLFVFLYHPQEFESDFYIFDFSIALVLGTAASTYLPPLRRLATRAKERIETVRTAARAAFVSLGVSRTRDRTGILVYISVLERRVEVVGDIGLDTIAGDPQWTAATGELERALEGRGDVETIAAKLRALGPILAESHPRKPDDVNELEDEVRVAS